MIISCFLVILYSALWWKHIKPWFSFSRGINRDLENTVLDIWALLTFSYSLFIIMGIIAACCESCGLSNVGMIVFILITGVGFYEIIKVLKQTSSSQCSDYIENFEYQRENNFSTFENTLWENYVKKETKNFYGDENKTLEWYNKWTKLACSKPSKFIRIFFIIHVVSLVLFLIQFFIYLCATSTESEAPEGDIGIYAVVIITVIIIFETD